MAESEIKRVNFFDGQFLKQDELNDLSNYAVHMQRRLLYVLFDKSGVIDTGSSDLVVDVPNAGQKAIRVRAGMAIGRRPDVAEAHEIILRNDVSPISLTTQSAMVPVPLQAADTGVVTIHYEEGKSGGDATHPTPTRINENAVITVHRNAPPAPDVARPLIELGRVAFDSMMVTTEHRQRAQISGGLTGGKPPQQPRIVGIDPPQALQGSTLQITIVGTKLDGATAIAFGNAAGIAAQIVQVDPSGTRITATLSIAASVAAGSIGFSVATPGGTVSSQSVTFAVLPAPAPLVSAVIPASSLVGRDISVRGSNIRDARIKVGQPAAGTTIAFVDPTTQQIITNGVNPTVAADIGAVQQLTVTLPPAAAWGGPPATGSLRANVRVIVNGVSADNPTALLRVDFAAER